ncbi:MAG TPA: ThuA domain-containing protein [Planctomycetaceae bacterium]|nr:ThuA domain-containing protein [Planctomycetaceae bacterium]
MKLRFRMTCAVLVSIGFVAVASAEEPPTKVKALFLTQSKGYVHGPVNRRHETLAPAEIAMTQLGQQTGLFDLHCTQDAAADITRENLKNYDIVMFYTTLDLPISPENLDHFINDWLKQKGHGFIGFHSATDTYHENETYWQMIGGTFVSHPWTSGKLVTIDVLDTEHPASRPFGRQFTITDEIYRYRHWQPDKVRVLMTLNMEKCMPILDKGGRSAYFRPRNDPTSPYAMPVAWVKDWGQGKVFYTNLGHNETTWTNKTFLKSVEGAVRWIRGLESGDATPNPDVSKAEEVKAKAAAHVASTLPQRAHKIAGN